MSPDRSCPSPELLRRSLDPDDPMSDSERQRIEAHVDCCDLGCKQTIDALLLGNSLLLASSKAKNVGGAFELAWRQGRPEPIERFLPAADQLSYLPTLEELARMELEFLLKAPQPAGSGAATIASPRVEDYLRRFPLLDQPAIVRRLLRHEYQVRQQRGEQPLAAEYAGRFPALAEGLDDVLKLSTEEAAATRDAAPEEFPVVAGYDILSVLGRGGMGIVYKARHVRLNRIVALKMILGGAHAGSELLERFSREAEAVAKLQHPNIVQIYEVGEADGRPFFSLEFVDGGSLHKQIADTPQPPERGAALVETLARGMQAAHERGIIHRDLKPANVLLTADGTPKITDFGLAKQLEGEPGQTRTGAVMGTPSHMAPEQASGDTHAVGPLADVYALGAILYELLTGRPPFKGANVLDTLDQVKHQEPVPPSRLQPKVPRDLETICLRCLHKEPTRRYPNTAALAADLRRYLVGEPIKARPVGLFERSIKYARRRPAVVAAWTATVVALLVLLGSGGYYQYRLYQDAEARVKRLEELQKKRVDAGGLLREGDQALLQEKTWRDAERVAKDAVALVGDEPGLEDLRDRAKKMQADAALSQQFIQLCNKAQYHEMLALEEGDRAQHLQTVRQAAAEAAALIGLKTEAGTAPDFDDGRLPAVVRAKLKTDAYQLLFPWSNAVAMEPGQNDDERKAHVTAALRILDRAPSLGLVTTAYFMRRAKLLDDLGDALGTARERQKVADMKPTMAVDFFLLGLEAKAKSPPDLNQEAEQLENALRLDPRHFWANYYLAANYVKRLLQGRAFSRLAVCIDMQPDFLWPHILRGLANGLAGDFEEAQADFGRAEQARPDPLARYAILVNRGFVRLKERKLDLALADFTKAAELRPGQWQAYANLAETYLQLGRLDDALAQLARALALQPSAALYRSRARLYLKRLDYARALPDLEEAIRREPLRESRDLADDHLERGKILYRQGKYADALAAFDAALTVNPRQPLLQAHQLRAEALMELNRFDEALRALDLVKGAATSATYRDRGLLHAKRRNYTGAIQGYTHALELDRLADKRPDPLTLAYRGWAYLITDAPQLALADFDEALKQDECDRVDCHNGRGYARVLLGQWKPAVADAEAALNEKPTLARQWYNGARIYAQAAGKVDADPAKSDAFTQDLRRRYEEKALQLLRLACEKTPLAERAVFWKEYVQDDPALRWVKRSAVYAQLAAEYGRRVSK